LFSRTGPVCEREGFCLKGKCPAVVIRLVNVKVGGRHRSKSKEDIRCRSMKANRPMEVHLFIERWQRRGLFASIEYTAKEKKIEIQRVDRNRLDQLSEGRIHQGVIAIATEKPCRCRIHDSYGKRTRRRSFSIVF
jgi:hypothetical protein